MTNYNERLDEIERHFRAAWKQTQHKTVQVPAYGLAWQEAKQAITSLIKELVAEAKPERQKTESMGDTFKVNWARGHNVAADQFEQNLLKALGEV